MPTLSLSVLDDLVLFPLIDDFDELDVNFRCEARSHFLKLPLRLAAAAAAADELLLASSFVSFAAFVLESIRHEKQMSEK